METHWFKFGKEVRSCILSSCLFKVYAEYIMWNVRLDEWQAGVRIAGTNSNSLRYANDITLMAGSEKELKSLFDEGERKSWLKTQHSKTRIMASGPITSWQTDGEKVETVKDFLFLGSKITADGDCSHEIKRHWLPGRKAMTNFVYYKAKTSLY